MLSYHPALDPYHAAFRAMQLLVAREQRAYHLSQFRILDFYLLFPSLVEKIHFPRESQSYKRAFSDRSNRYWVSGEPKIIFMKIGSIQQQGLNLLVGKELLDVDAFKMDRIQLSARAADSPIMSAAVTANQRDLPLLEFLVDVLGTITPFGPNGLKDRSRLMEFRYDAS